MDKEMTVDFVKSRLLDAELKLKGQEPTSNSETDAHSFLACFKCGKKGHKAYQCKSGQVNFRGRSSDRGLRRQ
ncbi:hypothetical protein evm_006804 [Chilo suppressalis]|nr:hypothetical protein evm_006804 [Chilo suppressalis]